MRDPRERMLGLLGGYWATMCLGVLADLGVPDALAAGPRDLHDLAETCGCDRDALGRLLRAAASAGFLDQPAPQRFAATALLDTLRSGAPGSLASVARLAACPAIWNAWSGLADAVRTGSAAFPAVNGEALFERLARDADLRETFHRVQDAAARLDADLLAALELTRFRRIVDVAGGQGGLASQVAAAVPDACVTLIDRPEVIAGVVPGERVATLAGDVLAEIPGAAAGADAYLLKHVLHDFDDDRARALLGACRRAMPDGARLFVIESFLPEEGPGGYTALHDVSMLVLTGGRERTLAAVHALAREADLVAVRTIGAAGPLSALELTPAQPGPVSGASDPSDCP